MRGLSTLEGGALFAVLGTLIAVGLPAFVRNFEASRLAEPLDGLNKLSTRSIAVALSLPPERAFPVSAPLTPEEVPKGKRALAEGESWQHPTWRRLGFTFERAHSFAFRYDSSMENGEAVFRATAHGDLDGDGLLSTFAIEGRYRAGEDPRLLPIEINREMD